MNVFITQLLYTVALFALCIAAALVAVKLKNLFGKAPPKKEKQPKQAIVYLAADEVKPKRTRPVAIKGTTLSEKQLKSLLDKDKNKG